MFGSGCPLSRPIGADSPGSFRVNAGEGERRLQCSATHANEAYQTLKKPFGSCSTGSMLQLAGHDIQAKYGGLRIS